MKIRAAELKDIPAITEIYNSAVTNTTAVWNETTVDEANRKAWLEDHNEQGYPVLVAVDEEDRTLGYATFGDWRAWEGYRYTVEHSVYVSELARGQGIATDLMEELIGRARRVGKHVMVAGISADNIGSIRLHEKLGFVHTGTLREVGKKFGAWLDLAFLQLTLENSEI